MEPFEVVLPPPPQALSPNARVHWAKRYKAARDYKEECGWTLKALRGSVRCPPLPLDKNGPVRARVIFYVYARRRRDDDNATAMLKPVWDAMVEVGWLTDDSHEHLTVGPPRFVVRPSQPARVVVVLGGAK